MPWKVKVFIYCKPEDEEIYQDIGDAESEANQVNLMQPEGCQNCAIVKECDEEGNEL